MDQNAPNFSKLSKNKLLLLKGYITSYITWTWSTLHLYMDSSFSSLQSAVQVNDYLMFALLCGKLLLRCSTKVEIGC